MSWIDTHSHLADPSLREQLADVLERARLAGVSRMLCVAVDAETCRDAIQIASENTSVWASVGIHPNYAHQAVSGDWESIISMASHPRVCAIGETGLDKYWDDCPFDIQLANFDRHWTLGRQLDLPLIIHTRDCEAEMLEVLQRQYDQHGALRGVMHSFAGSTEAAKRCVEFGLYISFSGILTYKKSDALRETAKTVPLDRLIVETDCPYLSPEPKRSQRPNEPALVVHTAKCLAKTIDVGESQLAKICEANSHRLFSRWNEVS